MQSVKGYPAYPMAWAAGTKSPCQLIQQRKSGGLAASGRLLGHRHFKRQCGKFVFSSSRSEVRHCLKDADLGNSRCTAMFARVAASLSITERLEFAKGRQELFALWQRRVKNVAGVMTGHEEESFFCMRDAMSRARYHYRSGCW